jgi:uncharacterized protein YegL
MVEFGKGVETPSNYEQKTICCFVIDVSGSMSGSPIDELNRGLREFHEEIKGTSMLANRLEVAIVEFCDQVNVLVSPFLVDQFTIPTLIARGTTKMVDGIRAGMQLVEERKGWYKQTGQPYLRPWIVLITDGEPDGDQDIDGLAREVRNGEESKKFVFLAVGVKGANEDILKKISTKTAMLEGLKFSSFFKWMSASMGIAASSKEGDKVNLPAPTDWTQGFVV